MEDHSNNVHCVEDRQQNFLLDDEINESPYRWKTILSNNEYCVEDQLIEISVSTADRWQIIISNNLHRVED